MVKRQAGCLDIALEEGTNVQVHLKRRKISTCEELRNYVHDLCGHEILTIKGPKLKVTCHGEASALILLWHTTASQLFDAALGICTGLGSCFP